MDLAQIITRRMRQAPIPGPVVVLLLALFASPSQADAQQLMFTSGGGPISLVINSAIAGSEPTNVTDNSTEIFWDANFGVTAKMTVTTSCPTQAFGLYVLMTVTSWASGTQGSPQAEVQLSDGMLDADIFRDIPATTPEREGFATLTYRAASTVAQGNSLVHGDDFHTVTFTIVAQ